jgi:ribulose-5-phosphate 4-epimerase/fuculose-1-phosphate aldolase
MAEVISEEQPRIKFRPIYQGDEIEIDRSQIENELLQLAKLQSKLEALGVIPILNDGLVGGNCAIRSDERIEVSSNDPSNSVDRGGNSSIFITKSGKTPGAVTLDDFVLLTSFDRNEWTATYRASSAKLSPSSDAPLHFAALNLDSKLTFGWSRTPLVAVHGHALASGEGLIAAAQAGMPISEEETLFSTPADLEALEKLFEEYPYPENRCYIRRGHGFFLLGDTVDDAEMQFEKLIVPLIT